MKKKSRIQQSATPSPKREIATFEPAPPITPRPIGNGRDKKEEISSVASGPEITNEVKLNVRRPIPLELENHYGFSPGGNRYIPFLTFNNDDCYGWDTFPNILLQTRLESSTLDAVIDSKANFTMGDGVYRAGIDAQKNPDPSWDNFVKVCNNESEGLNDVVKAIIINLLTFGNAPVEWVRGETAGKRWLHVYSKNMLDCRKAWPNNQNIVDAMIISRWFRHRGVMNLTQKWNIRIPLYRWGLGTKENYWFKDDKDNQGNVVKPVERTALWLRNKYAGYDHYGLPQWAASLLNANLEFRGGVYNYDNFNNGMNIGGVLSLEGGSVTNEDVKGVAKNMMRTYRGSGNGGKVLVVNAAEGKTTYTPFQVHKDGSYIDLDKLSIEKIIMANSWDGAFIGKLDGMSKAKSGAYLNELYQQKIKTVIKPLHRLLKDNFFTPLKEIADEWLGTDWSKYDIDIQVANLFNDTTEAATTVNGTVALTNIIKLVGTGTLPHANAVNLVAMKWGMSIHDAEAIINGIKVNLPTQTTKNITESE